MAYPPPSDTHESADITELVFELADPSYFWVGLSADQSCLVRLERSVQRATGTVDEFFTASDATGESIRERAARTPAVDSVRLVYEWEAEIMFQLTVTEPCLAHTLEAGGAISQDVLARDGTGKASALVPDPIAPRDVAERVFDRHPSAELVKRRSRDLSAPVFTSGALQLLLRDRLTDRQREVLRTAYRHGYWNRPRECTGEELADELGITSATFSQHIRAAYRNVFDVLFEQGGCLDDP
jgi:predicted DNA binding protein